MSVRRFKSGSRSFAGRPTGQEYASFHSALLSKCYPKRERASTIGTPVVIINATQGTLGAEQIETIGQVPVFVKSVSLPAHADTFLLDHCILDMLKERDVCRIRIIDTESGAIFDTFTNIVENQGVRRSFGHEELIYLPRTFWFRGEPDRFGGRGERYE